MNSVMSFLALGAVLVTTAPAEAAGDAAHGAELFAACASCHSLEPDRNLTGPSLAGITGRAAGSLASFSRYSSALRNSALRWDEATLDAWLASPAKLVPGNAMSVPGIPDARQRSDIIAFLETDAGAQRRLLAQAGGGGGMGGMMSMGQQMPDLKRAAVERKVQSIEMCKDSYRVTTADGGKKEFWEANLRFKTDSTDKGPERGSPVIMPAGMMGDRASVIFAAPEEISFFITRGC